MTERRAVERHTAECWTKHDDCALQAAADLLDVRMAHARSQRALIRGVHWGSNRREEGVELARQILNESHAKKWKNAEARP